MWPMCLAGTHNGRAMAPVQLGLNQDCAEAPGLHRSLEVLRSCRLVHFAGGEKPPKRGPNQACDLAAFGDKQDAEMLSRPC